MSISFLNPAFLFGLVSLSIPLVIHLIHRRNAIVHRFAALAFLLRTDRRMVRRFELKRLLLLLLRISILLFLTLAVARPVWQASETPVERLPRDLVMIVDTSMSMGFTTPEGTLLSRALRMVREILSDLSERDRVAIVAVDDRCTRLLPSLTSDRRRVIAALSDLRAGEAATDYACAFAEATALLAEGKGRRGEIVLFTDLTARAFQGLSLDPPRFSDPRPRLRIVDVAAGIGELPNRTIADVRTDFVRRSRSLGVEVEVRNHTLTPAHDVPIVLRRSGGETVLSGFADLPAASVVRKRFSFIPKGKRDHLRFSLQPDRLPVDDAYDFVVLSGAPIPVLLIDGDMRTNLYASETFYLERALYPGARASTRIVPSVETPQGLDPATLDDFALVALCNVTRLKPAIIEVLEQYVAKGGNLLVTLGDRVDPDFYDRRMSRLLPAALRGVHEVEGEGGDTLGVADPNHPLFSIFRGELARPRFRRYFFLEPGGKGKILLRFRGTGAPALLEARKGKGRVFLFTSSIDRDWNDLPIDPAFLPLMQQLIHYAVGEPLERDLPHGVIHHPIERYLPRELAGLSLPVVTPDGERLLVETTEAGDHALFRFTETNQTGCYEIVSPPGTKGIPPFFCIH
ncbi:MAG: VWA domain-containing protein, partial [Deltaproteobacteria bacterium]